MFHRVREFARRAEGQVSIIFAVMSVPLLIAAGAAIDYVRAFNVQTDLQSALDGAALSAAMAETKTSTQRVAIATQYFKKNFKPQEGGGTPKVDIKVNAKTISATATYAVPNSLMKLAGVSTSEITVTTEVMRAAQTTVELVLVVDYSGSMKDNDKYIRMSKAADATITSLYSKIASGKFKVGVVPFSAMVYTSMPSSYVTQFSWSSTWTGCTQDRTYPNNITVDTPTTNSATKWGYYDTSENGWPYDCNAYQNNDLKIVPLTTDINSIKAKLAAMTPVGNTNVPLGAEFGWNLLDPRAPYTEANPFTDKMTQKYIILLTDGAQTSKQSGADGTRSVSNGNDNLTSICKKIDQAGIEIFTIAYDVTDPAITNLLKGCASAGNYYEPDAIGSEIDAVFSSIAKKIENRMVHLSR